MILKIDNREIKLPIIEYDIAYEAVDSAGTGRMAAPRQPLFRIPKGLFVNIDKLTFGSLIDSDPDFVFLINTFIEMSRVGSTGFKQFTFLTPKGLISQLMYIGANFKLSTRRIRKNDKMLFGAVSTKIVAKEAYYF